MDYDGVVINNGRTDHVKRFLMNDRKREKDSVLPPAVIGNGKREGVREKRMNAIQRVAI
jgi:hypothetical protein